MTSRRKLLILSAIVVVLGLIGVGTFYGLAPVYGRVVGYANQQPVQQVIRLKNGWGDDGVDQVRRLASLHYENQVGLHKAYWPHPHIIEERANCWVVKFTPKLPVYEWLGVRVTARTDDSDMNLTIDKADFRTRYGIWCQ